MKAKKERSFQSYGKKNVFLTEGKGRNVSLAKERANRKDKSPFRGKKKFLLYEKKKGKLEKK